MQPQNNNKIPNVIQIISPIINPTSPQKIIPKIDIKQSNQSRWKTLTNYHGNNNQNGSALVILNRTGHCSFFYKNCIYFYGGFQNSIKNDTQIHTLSDPDKQSLNILKKQSLWNSFHKFHIISKQFGRQPINYGSNINSFVNICSFGFVVIGNILYVFGGMNYQTGNKRNPEIFSINLESGTVKRCQSKTPLASIPVPRLNPNLVSIDKNVIILMGGQVPSNFSNGNVYLNDLYIFKVQTKTWTKIQDTYHIKYPTLIKPSLISFGESHIYMFGGKRQILKNNGGDVQQIPNHEILRLKIVNKTINSKADCSLKRVYSQKNIPDTHTFIKIIKYFQKGIIAVTKDEKTTNNKVYFWYFEISTLAWCQIKQNFQYNQILLIVNENYEDIVVTTQKIIIVQKNGYIRQLAFHIPNIQSSIKQILSTHKPNLCTNCQQQKILGLAQRNQIPAQYLQQYVNPLQFPYAAIGLLVDSSIYSNAKNCNILFNIGSLGKQSNNQNNKNVYMIIQENGLSSNIWASQIKPYQYVNTIINFNTTNLLEDVMIQQQNQKMFNKSLKQIQQKQKNLQKQFNNFLKNQSKNTGNSNQVNQNNINLHFNNQKDFQKQQHQYIQKKQKLQYKKKLLETEHRSKRLCNNIKLAGITLGDTIIYACKQKKNEEGTEQNSSQKEKEIRRYFFMRKQKCTNTGKFFYVAYAYVTENGNAAEPKMESIIKLCSKEFKKQLKIVTQRLKTMSTVILVSDLKHFNNNQESLNVQAKMAKNKQLRLKKKQNDVFYGQSSLLAYLQANCLAKMIENCDISLKTYLGLLYLNNNQLEMYISIRQNQLQLINSQPFLNTIDRMLNSKKIIQVSKSLDFSDECTVVQVYWNPDHNLNNDNIANKINSFGFLLNGILIYHRNRLISRYGLELGKFLDVFEVNTKYGSTFGYLQINPQYGINLYSTDTLFPRIFQKYYSRIQFVNQFMQEKYQQKRTRPKDDSSAGNYQKISKRSKNQ